jgi:thiol-disulfide isomerase/thioredoxin
MLISSVVAAMLLGQKPEAACLDLKGNMVVPLQRSQQASTKATVLIFYLAHCPISQKLTPEINRLYQEFQPQGVKFFMVHEDLTLTNSEVKHEAVSFGLKPAIIVDKWKTQMKMSGATISPEAALYDSNMNLRYRGRINDLFYGLGKMRPKATQHDLRVAIKDVLLGKLKGIRETKAIGCILPKTLNQ